MLNVFNRWQNIAVFVEPVGKMEIRSRFNIGIFLCLLFVVGCDLVNGQDLTYDKRLNCIEFKLSKTEIKVLKNGIDKFYDRKFKPKDFCYGRIIVDTVNNEQGLFRASLFHPHFPEFYFIKTKRDVTIIEAEPDKGISFKEAADRILEKNRDSISQETIAKNKEYINRTQVK